MVTPNNIILAQAHCDKNLRIRGTPSHLFILQQAQALEKVLEIVCGNSFKGAQA
jgi:hypothetical protein